MTSCLNDKDQDRINLVQKLIGRMKDSKEMQKQYVQMLISSKMQISDDVLQHTQILDQNKLKPSIELKRQA